ncbi:hypothetical protein EBX93_15800, partial [bacterium]|nr:hypothetical protein [bacterium]
MSDGSLQRVGRFGGLFNLGRDDRQLQYGFQQTTSNMTSNSHLIRSQMRDNALMQSSNMANNVRNMISRQIMSNQGRAVIYNNMGDYMQRRFNTTDPRNLTLAQRRSVFNEYTNRMIGERARGIWSNVYGTGNLGQSYTRSAGNQDTLGTRRPWEGEFRSREEYRRRLLTDPQVGRLKDFYRAQGLSVPSSLTSSANASVFAERTQGTLSRLLLGQRMYTLTQGANGEIVRSIFGRRGGLLGSSSSMLTNSMTIPRYLANAIASPLSPITSRIGQFNAGVGGFLSPYLTGARMMLSNTGSMLATPFRAIGSGLNAGLGWYNNIRAGVGLSPVTMPRMPSMSGVGGFLFGRQVVGATGALTRVGGLLPMLGTGAMTAGRLMGSAGGALFRGAMGALPFAMIAGALGSAMYKGLANRGANVKKEDYARLGISADDNDFNKGLKSVRDK